MKRGVGTVILACVLVAGIARAQNLAPPSADPVAVARLASPHTSKVYELPVPAGLCRPEPGSPFAQAMPRTADRNGVQQVAALVPCRQGNGAPGLTSIVPGHAVPPGEVPEHFIKRLLAAEGDAETQDLIRMDTTLQELVMSPAFFGARTMGRVPDRDGDVTFKLQRYPNGATVLRLESLVAVDDHVFLLSESHGRPERGGPPLLELHGRRLAWLRAIKAWGRSAEGVAR